MADLTLVGQFLLDSVLHPVLGLITSEWLLMGFFVLWFVRRLFHLFNALR